MRIIAGNLKGRQFNGPPRNAYNPMSEKMRGALFNTLGDIDGLMVLDPFGGTGALSFEAISRGASSAVLIEHDKRAYINVVKNVGLLDLSSQIKAIRANSSSWSDNNKSTKFDLLLMDPPYDNLQPDLIQKLIGRHLNKTGVAVLSHPHRIPTPNFKDVILVTNKEYGDGELAFYRQK
jgi:16S rRNA (guanine966-N2)-methyltransferase